MLIGSFDFGGRRQVGRRQPVLAVVLGLAQGGEKPQIGLKLMARRQHGETPGMSHKPRSGVGQNCKGRLGNFAGSDRFRR